MSVTGDRTLLAQLAGNLLHNAVIHNVAGGWVRVAAASPPAIGLTVENSGPVLDAATVATLSEPFVRAAARTRGTDAPGGSGLGLAIVASITRAHGGSLSISARPEGGLHVRVTLPS
jgi:two-component system sensor histidine kinase VanS